MVFQEGHFDSFVECVLFSLPQWRDEVSNFKSGEEAGYYINIYPLK
jgi:hypothetical protein